VVVWLCGLNHARRLVLDGISGITDLTEGTASVGVQ
jgi:hypothetical protein